MCIIAHCEILSNLMVQCTALHALPYSRLRREARVVRLHGLILKPLTFSHPVHETNARPAGRMPAGASERVSISLPRKANALTPRRGPGAKVEGDAQSVCKLDG